jgi:hypothetical protein
MSRLKKSLMQNRFDALETAIQYHQAEIVRVFARVKGLHYKPEGRGFVSRW